MADQVLQDNQIVLNGQNYTLNGRLRKRYQSRFPAKVSVGPDDYGNEQYLSKWALSDLRGGIGYEELDESVDADRCWWSNCITDYKNHMLLGRLATELALPTGISAAATLQNTDFELAANWTNGARDGTHPHGGTYDWVVNTTTAYQDAATFDASWQGQTFTLGCWVWCATGSKARIAIDDGVGTSYSSYHSGSSGFEFLYVTATLDGSATRLRATLSCPADTAYYDDISIGSPDVSGAESLSVNYNGSYYVSYGALLAKLAADRSSIDSLHSFPAPITALTSSLNSGLYIFLGDSENYWVMDTSEDITQSDSADAYWAIQWDSKLFKINTDGETRYSTDPDAAAPTWTFDSTFVISDIPSKIERFGIGVDATGNDVVYCATNSIFKVMDFDNKKWNDTQVQLPDHPNGGKGFVYWHDGHYISYGLGIKKYVSGSTASVSEVGLDRNDGLPIEYNGEIVYLLGESASDVLFALVDASQTTGNSYSGLYAYTGRAWRCWWADDANNGAMHHALVSSASSGYAVYWDCGGSVYYIDLLRGNQNPLKLNTATQRQYYNGSYDTNYAFGGVYWKAQTFTPAASHTCSLVKLYCFRSGTIGTVTVSIRATDGSGHPTGADLASCSIDGSTLPTSAEWIDFDLGGGASLTIATKYAIVVRSSAGGSGSNFLRWGADTTSPSYSGGNYETSTNSGSSWAASSVDFLFEEWSGSSTFPYAASAIFISGWFDAGTAAYRKLLKRLKTFAAGITTTETATIKYRTNYTFTDLDSGWNTLVTLDTASENGEVDTSFGSGVGLSVNSVQFRVDLARGTTTTVSPDLQALLMEFRLHTKGNWIWQVPLLIDEKYGTSKSQKVAALEALAEEEYDITFLYRPDATNETHYVKLVLPDAWDKTGTDYDGEATVTLVEN